jgi:DNA mismatch repair protein MutL
MTEDRTTIPRRPITVLPDHLANQIAAGEVIQRPASAVKELVENSLDAGSREIVVVVKGGGVASIQVSDDGTGMDEADARAAFQRHATSKILAVEDLEEIRTFGFRGEALASIAAVSHVTLSTRRTEDETATVVQIRGGSPSIFREARTPGTSVTAQHLFFNVPARKKFLKSSGTEFRHVYDVMQRVALSHPEIAFQFTNESEEVFRLRPGTPHERLLDLFGERRCEQLIPFEGRTEPVRAWGYVGKPAFGQKSRSHQFLFMNRRYILNRTINHAVYSAYEHLLEKGNFPFFVLFLDVDPLRVDVNVHPAKLEAKFEDEQGIYRLVHGVVREALARAGSVPAISLGDGQSPDGSVRLRFTARQHEGSSPAIVDPRTGEIGPSQRTDGTSIAGGLLGRQGSREEGEPSGEADISSALLDIDTGGQSVWQLHDRYILCRTAGGLVVVDQHVAHERVLYEQALTRMNAGRRDSQQLMFPATLELNPSEHSLLTELLPGLREMGFDIAPFGKNTVVLNGIPADVRASDVERLLSEMLSLYREFQRESPTDARDNLLKSFACRAAVKAGDKLADDEMRELLRQLSEARMPYVCPHGRPILLRIPVEELDRRFGRK